MCQFSPKLDNFDFFSPNLPKNDFWGWNFKNLSPDSESALLQFQIGFEIQKTNVGIRISILENTICTNFQKWTTFEFLGPNLPKNGFWGRSFKILCLDSESASLRYYVHQFSDKMDNFEFLG